MIETLRLQRRSFDPVERAAQAGDFVMFDYDAEVDDYRFPKKGTERAGSVIGSGNLFEALDEALAGHKAGDDVCTARSRFPSDFGNENLAGKTAKVNINIAKVQEPQLPEVDDALRQGLRHRRRDRRDTCARKCAPTSSVSSSAAGAAA